MAFDASAARSLRPSADSLDFDFSDPFTILDDLKSPCSAPMSGTKAIRDYLSQAPLESSLNLDPAGKLHFHWANWAYTCQLQREIHAGNPARLDALEKVLSALKRIEVCLKSPRGTIITSLHELYESYLDPRLRASLFGVEGGHNNEREILFSDVGEAGPFTRLAAMKWFDKHIYGLFVFRKMLLGFVPQRQFRLGTSVGATWWLKSSPLDAIETTVHQISSKGVLFKVESRCDLTRLIHGSSENVMIHFPVAFLKESVSPKPVLNMIDKGETIPLVIKGDQLISDRVWQRNCGGEQSFFFIKAETLFGDKTEDFVKAAASYESWFTKELK
ncbi:MAG: hypothetical protein CME71_06545 [Halobacteriovorax sp.]|nr:hypothetical protein [Halobacteriovorax sp.]